MNKNPATVDADNYAKRLARKLRKKEKKMAKKLSKFETPAQIMNADEKPAKISKTDQFKQDLTDLNRIEIERVKNKQKALFPYIKCTPNSFGLTTSEVIFISKSEVTIWRTIESSLV